MAPSASISYYGIVRYLYNRSGHNVIMNQIIASTKFRRSALIQDISFSRKRPLIISSTNLAKCAICDKGIEDGFSVTAKSLPKRTAFFCDVHYY